MPKRIGEILVERGFLGPSDVEAILDHARAKRMRFGEAGMELGILTPEAMIRAFGPHFRVDFFHLDPGFFPTATRAMFPTEKLIEWGALPLGFKKTYRFFQEKKTLNIGMLNPSRKEVLEAIAASESFRGFADAKVYLILPNEFVEVMEKIYEVPIEGVGASDTERVDSTLRLFLEFP